MIAANQSKHLTADSSPTFDIRNFADQLVPAIGKMGNTSAGMSASAKSSEKRSHLGIRLKAIHHDPNRNQSHNQKYLTLHQSPTVQ